MIVHLLFVANVKLAAPHVLQSIREALAGWSRRPLSRACLAVVCGLFVTAGLPGVDAAEPEKQPQSSNWSWHESGPMPSYYWDSLRTDWPFADDPTSYVSVGEPEEFGENDSATGDESSEDDFAARLEKLEKEWAEHQNELDEKASKAKSKPTVQIGGRIHLDYWAFPETSEGIGFFEHPAPAAANFGVDPEDRFAFRRVRLEMQGDALKTMYWRFQIEFAPTDGITYKDVYLGFRELPCNQVLQIGNQKRPLGLDHLNSSRFNVFLERPLVIETFNEDARRLGILMHGNGPDDAYLWEYGIFTLENIADDGGSVGDAYQLSGNARFAASPWYDEASDGERYFHWAVAGMLAHPDGDADAADTNSNDGRFRTRPEARSDSRWFDTGRIPGAEWYEILAFESIFNVGPLQIVGEYQHNWMQRNATAPFQPDLQFNGWYIYANYILTGEHIPYSRSSGTIGRVVPFENFGLIDRCCGGSGHGWGAWGIGVRYSELDLSDGDIRGGEGQAVTVALNWYWTPYARLQFNVITGEIDDHKPVGGFTDGHYTIVGTRAAIDF
jgi:phosphate-selective porin OprO/OprP